MDAENTKFQFSNLLSSVSVPDKQCEQLKEKCFTSGGKCTTIDSGKTIECLCPERQWFTDDDGCKSELYILKHSFLYIKYNNIYLHKFSRTK